MRTGNRFINPVDGSSYTWPTNHNNESSFGKQRALQDSAPTDGLGLNPQQGDDQPLTFTLKGRILRKAQLDAFIAWWQLCNSQTIYFEDFAGEQYEVLILSFDAPRTMVAKNPTDFENAPMWVWDYTVSMRVIRILTGSWAGVTP